MNGIMKSTANRIMSLANPNNAAQVSTVLVLGSQREKFSQLKDEAEKKGMVFVNTKANSDSQWGNNLVLTANQNPEKTIVAFVEGFANLNSATQTKLLDLVSNKRIVNTSTGKATVISNKLIVLLSIDIKPEEWEDKSSLKTQKINSALLNRSMVIAVKE